MKFFSYSEKRTIIPCPSGSKIKKVFSVSYNTRGEAVLVEVGTHNLYDEIQSFKQDVDINNIIRRYTNGDVTVLNKMPGVYQDISNMPKNLAEAFALIETAKKSYEELRHEVKENCYPTFESFLQDTHDFASLSKFVQSQRKMRESAGKAAAGQGGVTNESKQ